MPRRGAVVSIAGTGKEEATPVSDAIPTHLDELYRFAVRLTHHADRARDIVHESVLRALQRKSSAVRDPRAWLFQILYRTFVSHYRTNERRVTMQQIPFRWLLQWVVWVGHLPCLKPWGIDNETRTENGDSGSES